RTTTLVVVPFPSQPIQSEMKTEHEDGDEEDETYNSSL
ncbi:hypothetical protein A2U01_0099880, partial [Trifolium medium]|nr:hypothetical protein [Trifolium medium]